MENNKLKSILIPLISCFMLSILNYVSDFILAFHHHLSSQIWVLGVFCIVLSIFLYSSSILTYPKLQIKKIVARSWIIIFLQILFDIILTYINIDLKLYLHFVPEKVYLDNQVFGWYSLFVFLLYFSIALFFTITFLLKALIKKNQ